MKIRGGLGTTRIARHLREHDLNLMAVPCLEPGYEVERNITVGGAAPKDFLVGRNAPR